MKHLIYYDLLTVPRIHAKLSILESLQMLFLSLQWLLPRYSHFLPISNLMSPLQRGLSRLYMNTTVAHIPAFTSHKRKYHHPTLHLFIGLAIIFSPSLDYNSHKGRTLSYSSLYPQYQLSGSHRSSVSTR